MATEKEVQSFIDRFAPVAQRIEALFGIPASVVLGQAAHESGWGKSAPNNAYFGVKGAGDAGSAWLPTTEEIGGKLVPQLGEFGKWSSPEASFFGYARFLKDNPRYTKAGVFSSKDPYTVIERIAAAGYATNSSYAEAVTDVIKGRDLTRYDLVNSGGVMLPLKQEAGSGTGGREPLPTITIDTNDKRLSQLPDAQKAIDDAKKGGYLPDASGKITFPIDAPFIGGNGFLQDLAMAAIGAVTGGTGTGSNPSEIADDARIGREFQLSLTGKIIRAALIIVLIVGILLFVLQALPQAQAAKAIVKGATAQ